MSRRKSWTALVEDAIARANEMAVKAQMKWLPPAPGPHPVPGHNETKDSRGKAPKDAWKPVLSIQPVIFNREVMLERLMGDEELVDSIIASFMEDIPRQLNALRRLVHRGDAQEIGLRAHTIKGAAANVGGEVMRDIAAQMEEAGRSSNLEGMAQWLGELEAQFELFKSTVFVEHSS